MKKDRTKALEFLRNNLGVSEGEYKVVFEDRTWAVYILSKVKIKVFPIDILEAFREFTNDEWLNIYIIDNIKGVEFIDVTSI